MMIRKVGSNRELVEFFKSKKLSLQELTTLLNISEKILTAIESGEYEVLGPERTRLINFYYHLHSIGEDTQ